MGFIQGIIIGVAVAMDAFAVSLSIGLNRSVRIYNKIIFCFSFSFFQFIFALLGGIAGFLFNKYVVCIPSIVGGVIVSIVGIMMIKEGMEKKEGCFLLQKGMYLILGISVSIDALVVGFTALNSTNLYLLIYIAMTIGVITFLFCGLAYILARSLKKVEFICKYADYIGGLVLIVFGIKMIIL